MMSIDDSYFNSFHTFRIEWQPGPQGYIHWYADNEFRFGIEAEGTSLSLTIHMFAHAHAHAHAQQ